MKKWKLPADHLPKEFDRAADIAVNCSAAAIVAKVLHIKNYI
jgi:hypothetical protein